MAKKVIQKVVLAGAILWKNKILILQRHENEEIYPGMWELPSGKKEPLEEWSEALTREIKEETGLSVKILFPTCMFNYSIEKEDIRDTTQINFLVEPINNSFDIKLSKEHSDFAWVDINEIDNYYISHKTKQAIKDTFRMIELTQK